MSQILLVHVTAGLIALAGGYAALFARKGGRVHRSAGTLFVCAMLIMGSSATVLAIDNGAEATALGGPLIAYLVITAVTTVRPRPVSPWLHNALMGVALAVGLAFMGFGMHTLGSATGMMDGVPAPPMFMNGTVALLAVAGDARVVRRGALRGGQRLARHLWRMCYALFVASGSFFLGQADEIPRAFRYMPALTFIALLPLIMMIYWLVRTWRRRESGHAPARTRVPATLVAALLLAGAPALTGAVHAQQTGTAAETAYQLGRNAAAEDDYDEAVKQFERAVQLDAGNATYHYWLGRALYRSAPYASKLRVVSIARRVKQHWERAVHLDPDQLDAHAGLVDYYAMAPGIMGGSKARAREHARVITLHDAVRGALATAVIAQHEGNSVAEVAAYELAISLAPDSSTAYVALADAHARVGRVDDAFAALERFSARRPRDRWPPYHYGRLAGSTGQRLESGERALRAFLAAAPPDAAQPALARAHYWLGQIAERRGSRGAAAEHYRDALRANPNSFVVKRALRDVA